MKKHTMHPLHNNVVIKQDETEATSYGNLIVPDIGKERPLEGIVVAIGSGTYTFSGTKIPMTVKVGDRVVFPAMGGIRIMIDGEEYIDIKETDIITVLKETENE